MNGTGVLRRAAAKHRKRQTTKMILNPRARTQYNLFICEYNDIQLPTAIFKLLNKLWIGI